jgi:hypothetical protein
MCFTVWHREQLIGETAFEEEPTEGALHVGERRHLAGIFRPTAYGRQMLPRLCGFLTASLALKEEIVRRGVDPDDVSPEMVEHLFETTAAGAHIIDIGRALSEVCIRDPGGVVLKVASMAFMDISELASLSAKLGEDSTAGEDAPANAAEFLVSVTLCDLVPYCSPTLLVQ